MTNGIFASPSFSSLGKKDRNTVRKFFHAFEKKDNENKDLSNFLKSIDLVAAFRNRAFLNTSVEFYSSKLASLNSALFEFMTPVQRAKLIEELNFAFYIFSAQFALDKAENRKQVLADQIKQIEQCAYTIHLLRQSTDKKASQFPFEFERRNTEYTKFLGLAIGKFIADEMIKMTEKSTSLLAGLEPNSTLAQEHTQQAQPVKQQTSITHTIRDGMKFLNDGRLYWVWGGGLVSSVLALLPNEMANKSQATAAVSVPQPFTGTLSWLLYYARFALNLSLLLKHTIVGPWMKAEERQIPWQERFKAQWNQRKFALLNDSIWATCNLACFFWLTGDGMLGYYGNLFTAGLLLMDLCLNTWGFIEACTQHNAEALVYESKIKALKEKIDKAIARKKADEVEELTEQLKHLEQAQQKHNFEWKYKKYGMLNDLTYSVALLASFAVVCCLFFPPSMIPLATGFIAGAVGAALCFAFTVITAAIAGGLEIAKIKEVNQHKKEEMNHLLAQYPTADENQKKMIYLQLRALQQTSVEGEKEIHYQQLLLIKNIFIKAIIPALVFSSFILFPLGAGVGVLVMAALLSKVVDYVIEQYKPKEDDDRKKLEFNVAEFQQFDRNPSLETINKLNENDNTFFKSKGKELVLPQPFRAAAMYSMLR